MKTCLSAILLLASLNLTAAVDFDVAPHSHIDLEWYWRYEQGRVLSIRILRQALATLKADARFTFTQDQVLALRPFWEELNAEDRAFLRRMVREGRFEAATGMLAQPDVNMSDFESLTRQLLAGKRWMEETLGAPVLTAWNLDTFGQTPQMPQLFARAGIPNFVFMRDAAPEHVASLRTPFRWKSPDGSTVVAHWFAGSYGVHEGPGLAKSLKQFVEHQAPGVPRVLIPWGDDATMPEQSTAEIERELRKGAAEAGIEVGQVRFTTPSRYFEELRRSGVRLPTYTWDFNPPLTTMDLRGLPMVRPVSKLANRRAEASLEMAEQWASFASLLGAPYPAAELRSGWERLLKNQNHDTIAGSHTDDVYDVALSRWAGAIETGRGVMEDAAFAITRHIDTSAGGRFSFVVFNSSSFERTERVEYQPLFKELIGNFRIVDPAGRTVPYRVESANKRRQGKKLALARIEFVAAKLPPMGYRLYRVEPLEGMVEFPEWKPAPEVVEAEHFRLRLDLRTGAIRSIVERATGRELLTGPANELVLEEEKTPDLEGQMRLTGKELREPAPPVITMRQDAVGVVIRVEGPFLGGRRVQEIRLDRGLPRIDFDTRLLAFPGRDGSLAAVFPLVRGRNLYEVHNAVIERPDGLYAAGNWAGIESPEGGVALLNQGTGGYSTRNGLLRLYLLRSINDYAFYHAPAASEAGNHHFRYSLYAWPGDWSNSNVVAEARGFNQKPEPVPVDAHPGKLPPERSFIRILQGHFEVTALKQAEDGNGLILRGHETAGRPSRVKLKLTFPASFGSRTNLLEQLQGPVTITKQGELEFDSAPFEFVTLRVR